MLLDFSFSNFKCFSDMQQFSMRRSKIDQDLQPKEWLHDGISSVAAVFGGNATGKSSFLEAFIALKSLIVRSARQAENESGFGRQRFMLNAENSELPTNFYIEFIGLDNLRYQYELSINDTAVLYESLYAYHSRRGSKVFERELDESNGNYEFKYGSSFAGARKIYEKMARKDVLYFSTLHDANCEVIESAYQTLANQIRGYQSWEFEAELPDIIDCFDGANKKAAFLSNLLADADLGVLSVTVEDESSTFLKRLKSPDSPICEHYKAILNDTIDEQSPELSDEEREIILNHVLSSSTGDKSEMKTLGFEHHGVDSDVIFSQNMESRGTLSSLAFFSVMLSVLSKWTLCLIDELDMSLHPKYVRELVRLFRDPKTNPHQSQLIFSSHDVTLMAGIGLDGFSVLDRDQIWFTEKDSRTGQAELFPLTSFHVRRDENYMRNYFNGVYGALPDARIHDLFLQTLASLDEE